MPTHVQGSAFVAEETVRNLNQDTRAVTGQRVGAGGTAMRQVVEDRQALDDNVMAFPVLDVDHESNAAGIVLVPGVIEPVSGRRSNLRHP